MISLSRQQFDTGDGKGWRSISSYETWFKSPFGISRTINEALLACSAHGVDAEMGIQLVPVVLSTDGSYEVMF